MIFFSLLQIIILENLNIQPPWGWLTNLKIDVRISWLRIPLAFFWIPVEKWTETIISTHLGLWVRKMSSLWNDQIFSQKCLNAVKFCGYEFWFCMPQNFQKCVIQRRLWQNFGIFKLPGLQSYLFRQSHKSVLLENRYSKLESI